MVAVENKVLKEGVDYTIDQDGNFVLSRLYLLKRGSCCGNICRNCPYGHKKGSLIIIDACRKP
jgi:hypothetical protein